QTLPVDVPVLGPGHAVAFLKIKGGDRVVGARTPEEGLVVGNDEPPEIAPEPLALRLALDRELAQIGAERRLAHERNPPVILFHVDARDLALKKTRREPTSEARLEKRRKARPIDVGEAILDENGRA